MFQAARESSHSSQRDLLLSLVLITVVVVFALVGLAIDRNWPKLLRVSLSYATYAGMLLALVRAHSASLGGSKSVPYAWFVSAGALAGVVSGIVRADFRIDVLVAGTIAAAVLLAGVHCFALRHWRRLLPATMESQ